MIYGVILTVLLASGQLEDKTHLCPDLVCVAYLMTAAPEHPGLSRIRVTRGKPERHVTGKTRFAPLLDLHYH